MPPVRQAQPAASDEGTVFPLWLRLSHWLNALGVIVMVTSGWRIYNASPIWPFRIPDGITLGGWLGGALQWHFAAMWIILVNGLFYLIANVATRRLFTRFFPLSPKAVLGDFVAALRGRLSHDDLRHYNAVQRASYLFVMVDLLVLVLSGLVLWKSVQFPNLRALFGGYETARIVHFVAMSGIVAFFVVHIVMVTLVPRTLVTMIRGR
ncbi:MAG: cytochrome b/b6 domain-containing protein [Burkholderiaceae bacterium]